MNGAGIYVHVPFCLTRCGYCDFNAYEGLDHLANRYVAALAAEAEMIGADWQGHDFVSVFLGGGTPTTLAPSTLGELLSRLGAAFRVLPDAEITCEANPDTVDEPDLTALRAVGVNRLSLGVQSFDPSVLAALERVHPPESARAAFGSARAAGFQDVNLDLIFGADGESVESWGDTVREAVALRPDHISCYALTVEPATPLGRKVRAGLVAPPHADLQAEMYELACRILGASGYEHYEISNWALPGHRSRHNMGYWRGRPYVGLGAGAHSHRGDQRWWNVRPPAEYIEMVATGRAPVGGQELLSQDERNLERLLLGLRTGEGVPSEWVDAARAEVFVEDGLARRRGNRLELTDEGMFLANEVVLGLADG
jgi:putative oxygen-independent coproporphyrinogen III oxidase